jgi:hypothetical protein
MVSIVLEHRVLSAYQYRTGRVSDSTKLSVVISFSWIPMTSCQMDCQRKDLRLCHWREAVRLTCTYPEPIYGLKD